MLGESALNKGRNLGFGVTNGGQTIGHVEQPHEIDHALGEKLAGGAWTDVGKIGA